MNIRGTQNISFHTTMWLFTCAVVGGLTLPLLIQDGMFMDALLYTSVANNLSTGYGTFWFPQFSMHNVSDFNAFHEQPPLGIFIQSLFFRLFGHSMYVERFYTFLMMLITAWLMVVMWRKIFKGQRAEPFAWLPVMLWMLSPICFWSYSNNMLENSMGIYTLGAVILLWDAMHKVSWRHFVGGGLLIYIATMVKGIPGLFPLATPFIIWMYHRNMPFGRMMLFSVTTFFVVALCYGLMFLIPEARESYDVYFLQRTLFRIDSLPTVNSRFYILGRLFMELLPQISLMVIIILIARYKKVSQLFAHARTGLLLMTIGISASLPLMLTMVQKAFYFVPALPFFALGMASVIIPAVMHALDPEKMSVPRTKTLRLVSWIFVIGVASYTIAMAGHSKRDKDLIHDVYLIGDAMAGEKVIGTPNAMWNNWSMQTYMMRYNSISMDEGWDQHFVVVDGKFSTEIPETYTKVNIPTKRYHLYTTENLAP